MQILFKILALLPLSALQFMGGLLGGLAFALSPKDRRRAAENLALAFPQGAPKGLAWRSAMSSGRTLVELPYLWTRSIDRVMRHVIAVEGWEHVEAARARGDAVVFLTPHIGCFEVAAQVCGDRFPIVCLYRPPRSPSFEKVMVAGRTRAGMSSAAADNAGVKKLLKALKRGEAIGMLPDQVPQNGEGIWVPYFGRAAYTMTLAARFSEMAKVSTVFIFVIRQAFGRYRVVVRPPESPLSGDLPARVVQINQEIEKIVLQFPEQYFWSYNRYKSPTSAATAARPVAGQ